MKNILPLLLAIVSVSCATIYNGRETIIGVHANEPVIVETGGTITEDKRASRAISVPRQWMLLTLTLRSDSAEKTILVPSMASRAYFANLLFAWFGLPGMFIDMLTPKWRGYPTEIYVNMHESAPKYYTYDIFNHPWSKYKNAITITPTRLISIYYPSVEFNYQRSITPHLATQFTAAYLLPKSAWQNAFYSSENASVMNNIGFKVGVEQKYYLKPTAPHGFYVSGEVNYHRTRYEQHYYDQSYYENGIYYDYGYYYEPGALRNTREDWFNVSAQMLTCNFKFGYQLFIENLTLDMFIGIGLRSTKVSHSDKESWNRSDITGFFGHDRVGNNYYVNFPFNFRLGWAF